MNAQMIRVISSPSSSTIGFLTLIFAICRSPVRPGDGELRDGAYNRAWHRPSAAGSGHRDATHEVFNQSPPLEDYDVFEADRAAGRGGPARGRRLGRRRGPRLGATSCGAPQTHRWAA